MTWLRPSLMWDGRSFQPERAIEIDEDGRIAGVVDSNEPVDADLRNCALLPGFVNAHSHAFQFGLRGRVQGGLGDHFFSWRSQMFELVTRLDTQSLFELSERAFRAMRAAGYTTVGEFHYLHHQPDGRPYPRSTALAEAVIDAARTVGLRICLLHTAYLRTSGVAELDLESGQNRFCDTDVEQYLNRHRDLGRAIVERVDPRLSLGAAPHSVRAVAAPDIQRIAADTNGPLHIHMAEQPREIDEAMAEYGCRPLEVLERAGGLSARTTLVHLTHVANGELKTVATNGARICFCPTTERDLGDGIGPSKDATSHGIPQCIGSDSQTQIEPLVELRLLEANERLRAHRRLVLCPPELPPVSHLLQVGTEGGARALNLPCGELKKGAWADMVAFDLDDLDLAGIDPTFLGAALVFSATPRAVRATWVGGKKMDHRCAAISPAAPPPTPPAAPE